MEQNNSNNKTGSSEDIDLGQLFQMMNKALNWIFRRILKVFIYLKSRAIILLGLIVLGVIIGLALKQVVSKKQKIEVIVQPNLESKNYLYDVVAEIQANIEAKDKKFFEELGVNSELSSFEIRVERIGQDEKATEEETQYLEMLLGFENSALISDVVRAEILNNTSFNHKITFYFKDISTGKNFAENVINYINSNEYYGELVRTEKENTLERIEQDRQLIEQIDQIINNYSMKMASERSNVPQGQIMLDNEKPLDVTGLFTLKNNLIRDIENKKLELIEKNEPIKVLNFGKPQQVRKVLFAQYKILLPLLFLGVFFFVELVRYLDKRSREL